METLIGVLIGGAIGLLSQLLSAGLQGRYAHERWLREQRVEIYREVVAEFDRYLKDFEEISRYGFPRGTNPDAYFDTDSFNPLYQAVRRARLVASQSVGQQASRTLGATQDVAEDLCGRSKQGAYMRAQKAYDNLWRAMQRDLGNTYRS